MKKSLLFLMSFIPWLLFADGSIYLTIDDAVGDEVFIYEYEDYFTNKLKPFLVDRVDYTGNVIFTFKINEPKKVLLRINKYEFDFFISPEQDYELIIDPIKRSRKFEREGVDSLNFHIEGLKSEYAFLIKRYQGIDGDISYSQNEQIESGFDSILTHYHTKKAPFFRSYFRYYLGKQAIDFALSVDNNEVVDTILSHVINKDKVQFGNPAYIELIKYYSYQRFYSTKLLSSESFYLTDEDIQVKEFNSFKNEIKDYKNDTIKELVWLNVIEKAFKANYRDKILLSKWLTNLENSLIPEIVLITRNLRELYLPFEVGDQAPAIHLIDQYDMVFTLDRVRGNVVFLCFFATWSPTCLDDIFMIQELNKYIKDDIQFICLIMDGTHEKMNKYINRNNFELDFVHGNDPAFKKAYPINKFPSYMVLDRNGKVVQLDTERPTKETLFDIEKLIKGL